MMVLPESPCALPECSQILYKLHRDIILYPECNGSMITGHSTIYI